jgi:hypothetical protein
VGNAGLGLKHGKGGGGRMTQALYAHMNKKNSKKHSRILFFFGIEPKASSLSSGTVFKKKNHFFGD